MLETLNINSSGCQRILIKIIGKRFDFLTNVKTLCFIEAVEYNVGTNVCYFFQ